MLWGVPMLGGQQRGLCALPPQTLLTGNCPGAIPQQALGGPGMQCWVPPCRPAGRAQETGPTTWPGGEKPRLNPRLALVARPSDAGSSRMPENSCTATSRNHPQAWKHLWSMLWACFCWAVGGGLVRARPPPTPPIVGVASRPRAVDILTLGRTPQNFRGDALGHPPCGETQGHFGRAV